MKKNKEETILYALTFLGFILFPFVFRKKPIKDWVIVYLLKAYISSLIDSWTVSAGKISYPVRLSPNSFRISLLFDYLLFPILCVFYNQFTFRFRLLPTMLSVFIFSIPMIIIEVLLERFTNLINFKKGWNWFTSFYTLTLTFWFVRGTVYLLNYNSKEDTRSQEAQLSKQSI
ncbi:CBO0543 family protein [Bacillus sp. DJP31]|uniref:CBO0543 family protein n=1 Tax=Bacillus sp. DJP31 TaxID=3409789 RepID=UPI003BB766B9